MKNNIIATCLILGVIFGNAIGLLIGTIFLKENIGIGLLIGNIAGAIIGLLAGAILKSIKIIK